MSTIQKIWSHTLIGLVLFGVSVAAVAMERLGDDEMSSISGQAGVTMEMESQVSMDTFSYFTNGNGIHLDDVSVGSAGTAGEADFRTYTLDIMDNGALDIGFDIDDQRVSIGGVRLDDSGNKSMGSFWMDRNMDGNFQIVPGGALSEDGYTFNALFGMYNSRLGYKTNGYQVFLDDVSMMINSQGQTLDVQNGVIHYSMPVVGNLDVGAIRYAAQDESFRGNGSALASYGSVEMDFDFQSDFEIQAGGRFGSEGLRVDSETQLNTASFLYSTNGYGVAFNDISGQSQVTDLRIDVAPDFTSEARQGLGFTLTGAESQASGNLSIGSIKLGAPESESEPDPGSIGSVDMQWLYEDQDINGEAFSNQVFLMAGGHPDAGPEGMRLASEWSLADAQLNYTTNGNTVIFDGIQSWGRGDVTVNVTGSETLGDNTQFYEGLRIGFDDVSGGYRMDGLRVDDETSDVQGGVELLSALGVYRNFEFGSLDGHYTLGPGGPSGEGITINSDIVIQDGRIGALTEQSGQGIWADDLEFESHIRDMTVDVTAEGLSMIQGEAWSTMDIGNLRVGDADNGASFGRIVWQRYGTNNKMVISALGSGSGEEGLHVALTHVFSEATTDRQNQFIWETGRNTDTNGNPINGSGLQLVMNNIHTDDVFEPGNKYGVKTDLEIDVQEADDSTGELGFSVNTRTRFRELNIGSVDLVHPDGGAATALQGVSIQNMDMESNLTATPIPSQ